VGEGRCKCINFERSECSNIRDVRKRYDRKHSGLVRISNCRFVLFLVANYLHCHWCFACLCLYLLVFVHEDIGRKLSRVDSNSHLDSIVSPAS